MDMDMDMDISPERWQTTGTQLPLRVGSQNSSRLSGHRNATTEVYTHMLSFLWRLRLKLEVRCSSPATMDDVTAELDSAQCVARQVRLFFRLLVVFCLLAHSPRLV